MKKIIDAIFGNFWTYFVPMLFVAIASLVYQGLGFILCFLFFIGFLIYKMKQG
jgi:uncharacterized membrane protein YdfJ with MMPL/SSD domain